MEISPIDTEEAKRIIRQLAFDWAQAELPNNRIVYADYIRAINGLMAATGNIDQTANVFTTVINQASALGRPSEWVEGELRFEAQAAAVGNRPELLLLDLERLGPVDDASLDLYNERLNRFK